MPKVLARGGEGLMIREPQSQYENRRSYTLLKIKKFYDAEVRTTPQSEFHRVCVLTNHQAVACTLVLKIS